jgi:hypothetical protein
MLRTAGPRKRPELQAASYQRNENPLGGNVKNDLSLVLKRTTTSIGRMRNR